MRVMFSTCVVLGLRAGFHQWWNWVKQVASLVRRLILAVALLVNIILKDNPSNIVFLWVGGFRVFILIYRSIDCRCTMERTWIRNEQIVPGCCKESSNRWSILQVDCVLHSHTYNRVHVLESGFKINEKIQSQFNFATGYENLVAISQNL